MLKAVAKNHPRLRMFAGPNGSGKSSLQVELKPEWLGVYVNADDMERELRTEGCLNLQAYSFGMPIEQLQQKLCAHCENSGLLQKHNLSSVAKSIWIDNDSKLYMPASDVNSYVSAVLADGLRYELVADKQTFSFETVMSAPEKIDFIRHAKCQGYRVYLYFVATDDPDINIARVKLRVHQGGHDVPEDRIRDRYRRSIDLLYAASLLADRTYVFDNSGDKHQLLVEIEDGKKLTLHTAVLPDWFVRTELWKSYR